jgi:hypothetical protein
MDMVVRTGETKASSGTLLASFAFSSPRGEKACLLLHGEADNRDGKRLQEECSSIVQQSLLGTEGEGWARLDGALKELNGLFKGFLVSGTLKDVHAIVALFDAQGALHVSAAGRGEAYLVRGGTASQITEFSKGKPVAAFVHISSGTLEAGDTIIFATQRLLRALTPAQLSQLAYRTDALLDEVIETLEGEKEEAAIATFHAPSAGGKIREEEVEEKPTRRAAAAQLPSRRGGGAKHSAMSALGIAKGFAERLLPLVDSVGRSTLSAGKKGAEKLMKGSSGVSVLQEKGKEFLADLKDPHRKRRAHLLLLAGAVAAFLVIWLVVSLATNGQRSKTRAELSDLMSQINDELRTADNRRLAGDTDGANAILQRAEERAKTVMDNELGLFRVEALDLLDRIRGKREEINNILRVPARVLVNMSSKDANISAQGIVGLGEGEFLVYDRQNAFRVLLNRVDDAKRVVEDDLLVQGANFPRYNSQVFITTGNSVVELAANQITPMKTDDPNGWITGKDIETYLRYLYVLSPEKKQIYKYERLNGRYGVPVEYNVNGDLTGALDMVIDTSVYVLKEGGTIVKLLRGETQPFVIRHAPEGIFKNVTKIFKVADSNMYLLDPSGKVIVVTGGTATGESSYVRQYVLEGEQLGTLQDLYVDPEESHLYVLDDKRVYTIDLETR